MTDKSGGLDSDPLFAHATDFIDISNYGMHDNISWKVQKP